MKENNSRREFLSQSGKRHYFSGIAEVGHISRLIQDFDGIFNQTMRNTRNLNNRSLRVKFLLPWWKKLIKNLVTLIFS